MLVRNIQVSRENTSGEKWSCRPLFFASIIMFLTENSFEKVVRRMALLASEMDANSDATFFLFFSFSSSMWSEIDPRSSLDMCDWSVIFHSMDYPLTLFSSLCPCFSLDQVWCSFSLVFPRPFFHCWLLHSFLPVNSCFFWSFIVFVCRINDWYRSQFSSIELVHPYTWVILCSLQTRRFTQVPVTRRTAQALPYTKCRVSISVGVRRPK